MENLKTLYLKDFMNKVDTLCIQIIENWCLCKYCSLFDNDNLNFKRWQTELSAYIKLLKPIKLKRNTDKTKAVKKIFVDNYEYNDAETIFYIINSKFTREGIMDIGIRKRVSEEFANSIYELISELCDASSLVDDYIVKSFGKNIV